MIRKIRPLRSTSITNLTYSSSGTTSFLKKRHKYPSQVKETVHKMKPESSTLSSWGWPGSHPPPTASSPPQLKQPHQWTSTYKISRPGSPTQTQSQHDKSWSIYFTNLTLQSHKPPPPRVALTAYVWHSSSLPTWTRITEMLERAMKVVLSFQFYPTTEKEFLWSNSNIIICIPSLARPKVSSPVS